MTEGTMRRLLITTILLLAPASIRAQSSASYRLDEHALNAGGRPAAGVVATSPSYRLGLDSIGESIAGRPMSGASYRMDGGFTAAYPPPGEVGGLAILADAQTLTWSWEPSATSYNVYTGQRSTLPGGTGPARPRMSREAHGAIRLRRTRGAPCSTSSRAGAGCGRRGRRGITRPERSGAIRRPAREDRAHAVAGLASAPPASGHPSSASDAATRVRATSM